MWVKITTNIVGFVVQTKYKQSVLNVPGHSTISVYNEMRLILSKTVNLFAVIV